MLCSSQNYDKEKFDEIKASSDKEQIYELDFGKDGADGKYCWKGQHSVFINEGAVNGLREMTISIMPSTEVYNKDATTQFA